MNDEMIRKAEKLIYSNIGEGTFCTLALIDLQGYPTTSTITASKAEGIEYLYFGTGIGSNKVSRIEACNRASICFNGLDYNINLVGEIEIIKDIKLKKEIWYSGLVNHFEGYEDPAFCVLKFKTNRYSLLIDWNEVQDEL